MYRAFMRGHKSAVGIKNLVTNPAFVGVTGFIDKFGIHKYFPGFSKFFCGKVRSIMYEMCRMGSGKPHIAVNA